MISDIGFYGKLPFHGDFISRRLPQDFILPWDNWLQNSLLTSQEVLREQWLQSYLNSPIWHFALSAGLSGKQAWIGIMMPSVDRVGRYFPLTIARKIANDAGLIALYFAENEWFDSLEVIALSALENDLSVEQFDRLLRDVKINPTRFDLGSNSRFFWDEGMMASKSNNFSIDAKKHLTRLASRFFSDFMPAQSLWRSSGTDSLNPCFLVVDGMLSSEFYSSLLAGHFQPVG